MSIELNTTKIIGTDAHLAQCAIRAQSIALATGS